MIYFPSHHCYDLIKCFEGFRPRAYYCPGRVLTIGYGTTKGVKIGDEITHEEALKKLYEEVQKVAKLVSAAVIVPINQYQFDALVSFAYNVGITAFRKSTLLKKLNAGRFEEIPAELLKWSYSNGHFLGGLRERRKAEGALFNRPIDSDDSIIIY